MRDEMSRPLALAATLVDEDALAIEHLFTGKRALIRLEVELVDSTHAREMVLLAANEILRFCPNVTVALPAVCGELMRTLGALAREIHGPDASLEIATLAVNEDAFDAVLSVGSELRDHRAWIAVNASGWNARVATSQTPTPALPPATAAATIFAALTGACLGAGQVFLAFVGRGLLSRPLELSLWTLETGAPGQLGDGPRVHDELKLDSLLVGCGGVANGFAYATARAPLRGQLDAVDKQSLRSENFGPYVCALRSRLGMTKAELIRDVLAPRVVVTARNERFHFFKARIEYEQTTIPKIVITGLDDERVRHDVQRLWAPVTIDMAAEELTAQLIVKDTSDDGICLIGAYTVDERAPNELTELAEALGLARERVADFESEITEADVAAAPPEKRELLEDARRRGQRICGRATQLDLHEEEGSTRFTPAVPFVTGFSGIVGAAQAAKQLLGAGEGSLHFQFSFLSYRGRKMRMRCREDCECAALRSRAA